MPYRTLLDVEGEILRLDVADEDAQDDLAVRLIPTGTAEMSMSTSACSLEHVGSSPLVTNLGGHVGEQRAVWQEREERGQQFHGFRRGPRSAASTGSCRQRPNL